MWSKLCVLVLAVAFGLIHSHDVYLPVGPAPLANVSESVDSTLPSTPKFVPTHEWQEILPGQAIPPGLHVRIDFQSGTKMAKLLDPEPESLLPVAQPHVEKTTQALAVVATDHDQAGAESTETYRKERELLNLEYMANLLGFQQLADDASVMHEMLSVITRQDPVPSVDEVRNCLEVIEDLVHKYDNAVDFMTLGGLDVVTALLRHSIASLSGEAAGGSPSTDDASTLVTSTGASISSSQTAAALADSADLSELVASFAWWRPVPSYSTLDLLEMTTAACWVVGTAAQNNAKVQAAMLEDKLLENLIPLLRHLQELPLRTLPHTDVYLSAAAKVWYAVSNIVRSNQESQRVFHLNGGVTVLREFLSQRVPLKLQRKALNLALDLVTDFVTNNVAPSPRLENLVNMTEQDRQQIVEAQQIIERHSPTIRPSSFELYESISSDPQCCAAFTDLISSTDSVLRHDALKLFRLLVDAENSSNERTFTTCVMRVRQQPHTLQQLLRTLASYEDEEALAIIAVLGGG